MLRITGVTLRVTGVTLRVTPNPLKLFDREKRGIAPPHRNPKEIEKRMSDGTRLFVR